jgi:hypothetical protein
LAPDNIAKYLAIHWKKAENVKKAIIYYAKAAENFIRVHCYRDATMFLGKANLLHASLKSIDDINDNMNNFIKWYASSSSSSSSVSASVSSPSSSPSSSSSAFIFFFFY